MSAEAEVTIWTDWAATAWRVARRTWRRFNGRDVMLFAGGVSFFGLLAIFPGVAVAVTIFGMIAQPQDATAVIFKITELMPPQAGAAFGEQLRNLTGTSRSILSLHGLVASIVALYGAMRGVKAVLAGLNRVCTSEDVRGILSFNLLAAAITVGAIFAAFVASLVVVSLPVLLSSLPLHFDELHPFLGNVWMWSGAAMFAAYTLLYRFAMAAGRVRWRASVTGASLGTLLWITASAAFFYYVSRLADFRATYGSIGAVVVFLMWIYVAAYTLFFGAALATEAEIELEDRAVRTQLREEEEARAKAEAEAAATKSWRKRLWTRLPFVR